ncbi:MAG: hypothetical protein AB1801_14225 [Chloroflexota bacterium]
MKVVSKWEDIEKNIMTLEEYRNSDREFYIGLIKRGICFVVFEYNGEFLFGPSRFVGYFNNNAEAHLANKEKHGGKTNPAISKILGSGPVKNEELEQRYEELCDNLGVKPSKAGSYGQKRKYWLK